MIGILVGRFQVPELTKGHIGLLEKILSKVSKLVIFIGDTKDGRIDTHDPLSFEIRRNMIYQELNSSLKFIDNKNKVLILRLVDVGDFKKWTQKLDWIIDHLIELGILNNSEEIIMFGSRDSFIFGYKENNGKRSIEEIKEIGENISGTKEREKIYNSIPLDCSEFRKGIIWGIKKREDYENKQFIKEK